jgi:hypothetical protein
LAVFCAIYINTLRGASQKFIGFDMNKLLIVIESQRNFAKTIDKWKKVATLKGSSSTSYTKKGLSKNKTYYFRVRAYKTFENKNYYGAYSSTDAAKTKSK